MTRAAASCLAGVAAIGLAGCGLPHLGSGSPGAPAGQTGSTATVAAPSVTSSTASALSVARRTHEYPSPPARQSAASGAADPVFVIEAFATAYVNWTASTVARRMRALAQISVGQARSEVQMAAAETARDYELKRSGIANAGIVEAIAPVVGARDQYAVVTRERTTATNSNAYQGLRPAWHLALATVTRLHPGQWVVSAWQPES